MLSSFISGAWSFNVKHLLSPNKLNKINFLQQQHKYIFVESATEIKTPLIRKTSKILHHFVNFSIMGPARKGIGTSSMLCYSWKIWLIV